MVCFEQGDINHACDAEVLYTMGVLEEQRTHVSLSQKLRKEWFHAGIVRFEFQRTQYVVEKAPTMDHKAPQQSSTDWRRNWRQRVDKHTEKGTAFRCGRTLRQLCGSFGSSVRRVTSIPRDDASTHVSAEKVGCDSSASSCEVTNATIEFESGITGTFRVCFCSSSEPPLHHRGTGDSTASPSSGWCPELRIFGENGRILEWSFSAQRIRLLKIEETAPGCTVSVSAAVMATDLKGLKRTPVIRLVRGGHRRTEVALSCSMRRCALTRSWTEAESALADALHRAAVYQGLSRAVSFSGIGDIGGGAVRNCYTTLYPDGSNKTLSEPNHEALYKSEIGTTGNDVVRSSGNFCRFCTPRCSSSGSAFVCKWNGQHQRAVSAPSVQARMKETFEIDPSAIAWA